MEERGSCKNLGCDSQDFSLWLYNGQQFCKGHYNEKFLADLMIHFEAWDGTTEPSERLKYLIGRYYSEHETAFVGRPSLTKAIVHERSFNWIKEKDCVIFTVIRHPVDRKLGYPYCFEIHQTWKFNTKELTFIFLSEEKVA
jgi:hypothetical protein